MNRVPLLLGDRYASANSVEIFLRQNLMSAAIAT
jgi:hypothetical protein